MGHGHESQFASARVIGVRREGRTLLVFEHEHHCLDLPALTVAFFVELRRHQVAAAIGRQERKRKENGTGTLGRKTRQICLTTHTTSLCVAPGEGVSSRPIRHVSTGRGRGAAPAVPRDPWADTTVRPAVPEGSADMAVANRSPANERRGVCDVKLFPPPPKRPNRASKRPSWDRARPATVNSGQK